MAYGYLTCTRCFRETHSTPDWGHLPAAAVISLCENWLCDGCLDDAEYEETLAERDRNDIAG